MTFQQGSSQGWARLYLVCQAEHARHQAELKTALQDSDADCPVAEVADSE